MHEDLISTAIVFHKKLNPKIWSKGELKPVIRAQLLKIARHFIEYIDIGQIGLADVTISGSNAGYTYSRNSDLDLHLIVKIPQDRKQLLKQLFQFRLTLFLHGFQTMERIKIKDL